MGGVAVTLGETISTKKKKLLNFAVLGLRAYLFKGKKLYQSALRKD